MTSELSLNQILSKYDRRRIKAKGDDKMDQFFVLNGELHYIDLGAAEICESCGMPYKTLDSEEEFILLQDPRGDSYNALQMQAALAELGILVPKNNANSNVTVNAGRDVNVRDLAGRDLSTTTNNMQAGQSGNSRLTLSLNARLRFFEEIREDADVIELERKANELTEFVRALKMGDYYAKRIQELTQRPKHIGFMWLGEDEAATQRRKLANQEHDAQYREQLRNVSDQVRDLANEVLGLQG